MGPFAGALVPMMLWFSLLPIAQRPESGLSPLSVLGIAYGTADWLNLVAFGLYFYCATKLRREHQLRRLLCRGGSLCDTMGRALLASRGLAAGEVVLRSEASVAVLLDAATCWRGNWRASFAYPFTHCTKFTVETY